MTFTTYDPSEALDRDKVRGRIGDIQNNGHFLEDETIAAILSLHPNVTVAALHCVDRILAKIARDTDRSAAGVNSQRAQIFEHYKDLRAQLAREVGMGASIFFGGISESDNDTLDADTDWRGPTFRVGQDDYP